IAVLVLLILSGVISAAVVQRYVSRRAALLALLFFLPPAIATAEFVDLANPTLLPLPLSAYYALLALCIDSGSVGAAVAASLSLSVAMSANITCVLMLPFHIAVLAVATRRPLAALAIGCVALVIAFTLESPGAARALGGLISSMPLYVAFSA